MIGCEVFTSRADQGGAAADKPTPRLADNEANRCPFGPFGFPRPCACGTVRPHARELAANKGRPVSSLNVLVSGAGIAGSAVAYWLAHFGHSVTVVERSGSLRS